MMIFDLLILLSRYLFIGYILFFIYYAIAYVAIERKWIAGDLGHTIYMQRILVFLMHTTAFSILAYRPETSSFSIYTLVTGGAFLVFFAYALITMTFFYNGGCPLIWNLVFFLLDIGLITLVRLGGDYTVLAQKQLVWMFLGYTASIFIPVALHYIKRIDRFEKIYLFAGLVLIASPFIIGKTYFGALNWVEIAGVGFQPSEIVKFIYVLYLATVFRHRIDNKKFLFASAMAACFVMILVMQKDLGGAFIYFVVYLVIMYCSTGSHIRLITIMGAAVAVAILCYQLFPNISFTQNIFSHLQGRLDSWLKPWQDVTGAGYQIVQSLFAIGTWGLLGSGLTKGASKLNVPFIETDMIFASICEEFGSLFGMLLLVVFLILFYRGVHIALRCENLYHSLVVAGFTAILAFQTFIIIGGVINLLPLTGVTLPFISYGGSSVTVSLLMIGILEGLFITHRKEEANTTGLERGGEGF